MRTCSSMGYKSLRLGMYGTAAAAPLHALELFGAYLSSSYALRLRSQWTLTKQPR